MILRNFYKILIILLLISPVFSYAQEQEIIDFYKTVRCLVCDGQSIYDSETLFAQNLREQIQIKYNLGDFVLYICTYKCTLQNMVTKLKINKKI